MLQIWPFVQIIKFYFVPLRYRLVAAQAFALIWNTFVAYKSRAELEPADKVDNNNNNNNSTSVNTHKQSDEKKKS
jgi:hypothetical protein